MMNPSEEIFPNAEETIPAGDHHPLQQIAESAKHRLLLKQWLKEGDSIGRRVALLETKLDSTRKETIQLCCFYFLFHGMLLTMLYNAAARSPREACIKAWIPSLLSLVASLVIIWGVRHKMDREKHMERLVHREKEDEKLLCKCVEELKRKGTSFDLLKEVDTLRRAKSLWVEPKGVMKWTGRDLLTAFLVAVSCLILAFTKLVLCN